MLISLNETDSHLVRGEAFKRLLLIKAVGVFKSTNAGSQIRVVTSRFAETLAIDEMFKESDYRCRQ